MSNILTAVIQAGGSVLVGLITFFGIALQNTKSNRGLEQKLQTAQAVTDAKLEELTREVREHNKFAVRMPVVENDIQTLYHRLNNFKN